MYNTLKAILHTEILAGIDSSNSLVIKEINNLQGNIPRIPEGIIDIAEIKLPDEPKAVNQVLSKEAVSIAMKTIKAGAETENLDDALEIGYKGFGEIACTDAAKEGISAFIERRRPEFKK